VIRRWVSDGGTLISSYRSGLMDEHHQQRDNFALADVFGVDYVSEVTTYAYDDKGNQKEGNSISTFLESSAIPWLSRWRALGWIAGSLLVAEEDHG